MGRAISNFDLKIPPYISDLAWEAILVSHNIDNNGYPVFQWQKNTYPADCGDTVY